MECPDTALAAFLDGLIVQRRGPRKDGSPAPEAPEQLTNNAVFKKLRIALSMHEKEVLSTMAAGGHKLSKGELSALVRSPGHKNYRPCGDQILRSFLGGSPDCAARPNPANPRRRKPRRWMRIWKSGKEMENRSPERRPPNVPFPGSGAGIALFFSRLHPFCRHRSTPSETGAPSAQAPVRMGF